MAAPVLTAMTLAAGLVWGATPVRRVDFVAPGQADLAELRSAFGLREGAPLTRTAIRAGVQALVATGKVEDALVSVEAGDAGALVVVQAQLTSRVDTVVVTGLPRRLQRVVVANLGLARGRLLTVESFERSLRWAQDELRSRGFVEATLDPDLRFDLEKGTVAVRVAATPGPERVLRGVVVQGVEITEAEALRVCELKLGGRLGDGNLDGARRRLAEHLRREGWWEADVDTPRTQMEGSHATVTFQAMPGPRHRLELEGLASVKELAAEALPFLTGQEPFAEAAIDTMTTGVRLSLQRQGYLLAKAAARFDRSSDERVLHLKVERGPRTPIVAVRFPGGEGVDAAELEGHIGAFRGRPWRWGREGVDEQTLEADAASVQATLQAHGYADASVENFKIVPEGKGVAIELQVHPGPHLTVTELTVEGIPEGVLVPVLPLVKGGPWSQLGEEESRTALLAVLQNAGFADAAATVSHTCSEGHCGVRLTAAPGERIVVDRVVIAGLEHTKRSVVEAVVHLKPGESVGPGQLLEAQRRLLSLGLFSEVGIEAIPGQESGTRRGLLVNTIEGPSRAVSYGMGWDSERKAQLSASWSELSLFGTGRVLTAEGRVSSKELRFQVSYREPARLGLLPVPAAVSVFRTEEHNPDYDLLRRGMWIELGNRMRRPSRLLLRYDYQITEPTAPPDVLSELERDEQEARIASITPSLEWDTRDDLFSPGRGAYLACWYQRSFRLFQADALFDKVTATASGFAPLGSGTLAANARVGAIWSRSGTQQPPPAPIDVPIAVRFFAGGRVSHRAFPTDKLGIPGQTLDSETGESIGGGGLVSANLEWRFKVWGPVGGSVFVDGGNVWREPEDVRLADLRWGAGLGVRVETPVGPLRLEYGWKLDQRLTFGNGTTEKSGQLYISFGNPF